MLTDWIPRRWRALSGSSAPRGRGISGSSACRVVRVASQLPRFKEEEVRAQLQRLHGLEGKVDTILESVRKLLEKAEAIPPEGESHSRFERRYCEAVAENVNHLELFGVGLKKETRRYELSVAYISLGLHEAGPDSEEEVLRQKRAEELLDELSEAGRLLVRGHAGSGKSTLFRWAARTAALGCLAASDNPERRVLATAEALEALIRGQYNGQMRGAWRTRVPFMIRLRECVDGRIPSPERLTEHGALEVGPPPTQWVQSVLAEGRALLLIDGVDEVPRDLRHEVEKSIERYVRAYPECTFLLSSRPLKDEPEYGPPELRTVGFRVAEITPLSGVDLEQLIDGWHKAVALKLEQVGQPAQELPELAQELKAKLRASPPLRRFATNPLLAAVICAIHRERERRLPESLDGLCESLCEMLLHRRESEVALSPEILPEIYRELSYEEKKRILRALAHDMVRNDRSMLEKERALQEVAGVLGRLGKRDSVEAASAVLEGLIERSGMLREAAPGMIDFIHNTFKEYLAAEVFVEAGDDGVLAKNGLDPDWRQVLIFAVLRGNAEFNSKLIQWILAGKESKISLLGLRRQKPSEVRARQFVAIQLEASARELDKEVRQRIAALRENLSAPETAEEAEAMASAGDLAVRFLGYRTGMNSQSAVACIRALRLIGSQLAQQVLQEYLGEIRWEVVEELVLAVEPLKIQAVREALLAGRIESERVRSQIRDLNCFFEQGGLKEELASLQSVNLLRT